MDSNTTQPMLLSNSISTLIVSNLVQHEGGSVPITLQRLDAPLNLVPPLLSSGPGCVALPPRTQVQRPPPGDIQLTLSIKDRAGDGATGQVYHVEADSSTIDDHALPPLVIKVCRPNRLGHIAREAWFYDELAILQGVCIPRCFGWFEADLPDGHSLPEELLRLEDEVNGDDPYRVMHWGPGVIARSKLRRRVSVLLLERLGDILPPHIPVSSKLREDVAEAFAELSNLHVDHRDVRYVNVLQAPSGPSTFSGLPSPRTGRLYECRIVDFEISEKYNLPIKEIISDQKYEIDVLLRDRQG